MRRVSPAKNFELLTLSVLPQYDLHRQRPAARAIPRLDADRNQRGAAEAVGTDSLR